MKWKNESGLEMGMWLSEVSQPRFIKHRDLVHILQRLIMLTWFHGTPHAPRSVKCSDKILPRMIIFHSSFLHHQLSHSLTRVSRSSFHSLSFETSFQLHVCEFVRAAVVSLSTKPSMIVVSRERENKERTHTRRERDTCRRNNERNYQMRGCKKKFAQLRKLSMQIFMVGFTGLCALNSFALTLIGIFYTGYHLRCMEKGGSVQGSGRSTRTIRARREAYSAFSGAQAQEVVEVTQAESALAQQSCRIPGRMRLPSLLIFPKSRSPPFRNTLPSCTHTHNIPFNLSLLVCPTAEEEMHPLIILFTL